MLFEDLDIRIQKFYCRKCGKFTVVCAVACNVVQYWGTSVIAAVVVSEEVTGDCEIFHSDLLGDTYSSTDVIDYGDQITCRVCGMYGGGGECNYRVLVWKLKE
jgi:hypothetical protein